ncbi:hypothetical protein BKA61DRAFT_614774 [Leptodontidium sp. MPI-SDFR-AT-0119]|nr:hypothetical protein BKA61DRAFT_614774 [Leptodontidium sp. MPI-SDFR-AT-0119]
MVSLSWAAIAAWLLLQTVAGRVAFPGRIITRAESLDSYEYVIVGGGTSGLVVANRLSENPKTTVLIIEAGDFDQNEDFITIPAITSGNIPALGGGPRGSKYDWNLTGIPQADLQGRSVPTPAGKVIGGGTVLNGMVFHRGSKSDYDRWQELGNPGWSFDGLLPYFKKSETFTPPDPDLADWKIKYNPASHGFKGFVQSSFPRFVWPSTKNYIKSMLELNIPVLGDPAGGNATGASWFTLSLDPRDETRSTAEGFYTPQRPNLHLLTHYQVTKLHMNSKGSRTAVMGVEYSAAENEKTYSVTASKDVILAAGTLHTPQILLLSGIGDTRHLSSVGIKAVVDLPGVGANYQDHLLLVTAQSIEISINTGNFTNATWNAEQRALYDQRKKGPYTTVGGNVFAFLPLSTISNNTAAIIAQASAQSPEQHLAPNTHPSIISGFAAQKELLTRGLHSPAVADLEFILGDSIIIPGLHQPYSRGRVFINSTSAFDPPVIDPRYLSNPIDTARLVEGVRYARKIQATNALQEIKVRDLFPGPTTQTDEQLAAFVVAGVNTLHHHSGTASMLPRELGGVVDSKLRVYGVEGLRIVDASVFPMVPAAHIQATVYAVAEKAADIIKGSI